MVCWLCCVQWFEDRTEQLNMMEHDLHDLHGSIELLVTNRKGVHVPMSDVLSSATVVKPDDIDVKKALGETQTLRAGCSKAEPKIFAPLQTPFSGAQDGQNLISWRWSLPSPTDPVWWRSMHAISSYRGNRPTKPQTHNARPPTIANWQDW